jgi:hypothetical protein
MTDPEPVVYFYGCMANVDGEQEVGHYMYGPDGGTAYRMENPWGRCPDGSLCPAGPQRQGVALLSQKDGWTAIGFWDRTGDTRGNSNSNFLVQGTYSFDEMVNLAREAYPKLWNRFRTVVQAPEGTKPNPED